MHPEWAALPGGQLQGWTSQDEHAQASFLVWGSEIAVLHAESDQFRNLEAWVDGGQPVTLEAQVDIRRGYLAGTTASWRAAWTAAPICCTCA